MLFFICFLVQIWVLSFYRDIVREKEINAAKSYGNSIASGISLTLNTSINTTQVIKNLYLEYGDTFLDNFDRLCKSIVNGNQTIGSLYLAPDAIIQKAYPKEVEASTIGFEMLKDPEQAERSLLAIRTKRVTVAGPHKLVEGGTGFIIRNPIFEGDEFKAFSIVVLDWEAYVKQVLDRVSQENSGYKFGVWKADDEHAVTDEYGFMFKNCEGDVSKLVDIEVRIPNDVWHLSVEPVNGWKMLSNMYLEYLLSLTVFIIIMLSVYLRQLRNARNIYIAQHDSLTGIFSRSSFLTRTEYLLKNNPDVRFNIVAADIESFKVTNSMYGTETGDEILKYLANAYKKIALTGLCSRYGGDQFVFILPHRNAESDIKYLEKVAEKIHKEAPIENLIVKYGFCGDVDRDTAVNLICDRALLAAKSILHNYEVTIANYNGPVSSKNIKEQILESSFLNAIRNEDFKVWFQPKFDAVTEKLVGAEALVRWIKDDGSIISPVDFIHVFEEDGLIYKLDLYVFETVCKQMKYYIEKGYTPIPISINISRTSLQHKNIVREYEKIIKRYDVSSEYLPLEITESSSIMTQQIKQLTEDLKSTGFKIHMDDFGTGVSSLESLNFLPFDCIKLDKSLIDYIGTPVGEELLRHTIELVQFMNLKIIAEGVETKEQLEFLRKLKCDHIQGYYYAAPMSYENFIEFLKRHYDGTTVV